MLVNFEEYIIKYKNISLSKEKKRDDYIKKYLEGLKVRSFSQGLYHDFLYITFVMDYMSHEYKDTHDCFFITLTLDSRFHHESLIGKKKKRKIKKQDGFFYNDDERISEGYSLLNRTFRDIVNGFILDDKHVKNIKYSRVIEPHKDFTPHLHSLVFIPKEYSSSFLNHYKNKLKKFRKLGLGRQEKIELIRDSKAGSSYITKYIKKSFVSREFDGWKRHHKIRSFTYSRTPLPRYLFNLISGRVIIRDNKYMEETSYFHGLLDSCYILIEDFDYYENKIRERIIGNKNSIFGVFLKRTRVRSCDLDIFDNIIYSDYYYKIYKVNIINGEECEMVFEKNLDILTYGRSLEVVKKSEKDVLDFMFVEDFDPYF